MTILQSMKLGDCFKIKHGFAFKGKYFSDDGDYIITTPGNFYDQGGFKPKNGKEKFYKGPLPKGFIFNKFDLVIAMTEQSHGLLGSSALIPEDNKYLHNQRLGLIYDIEEEKIDKHFLYYIFNTSSVREQIQATANGAKVRHTSPSQIYEVKVSVPSVLVQRRIASILSTYDDLIENNTRRIAILEEMARRLYEEWFVNFRFPGHETARFVETELGLVPEGWEVVRLEDVTSFISRGISPTYDDNSECRVINQKCIRDRRLNMKLSRGQSKHVPDNKFVIFGDVLINSTGVGTLGRISQVYEQLNDTTVDSHVTIVRPAATVDIDFFGLKVMSLQDFFTSQGVGSTGQTELSRVRVADTKLVVPPFFLQLKFGKTISSSRVLCTKLMAKNANLRAQRDLLLPKLISGEIDVSEAEDLIEEAAV